MNSLRLALVAAAVLALGATMAKAAQVFEGAWFRISFPDQFVAAGSLPSSTADGFDSAFFRDPQGRVEFYVYAPQAGGSASDIAPEPMRERLVAETESQSVDRVVRWRTYVAKDESYFRSIESSRSADGTEVGIFAIKYRSANDVAAFRGEYQAFKRSLERFAD